MKKISIVTLFILLVSVSRAYATWVYTTGDVPYTVGASTITVSAGPDVPLVQPQAGVNITGTATSTAGNIVSSTWQYIGCTPPAGVPACSKPGVVLTPNETNSGTHTTTVAGMDGAPVGMRFTYQFSAIDSAGNTGSDQMDVYVVAASGTDLQAIYVSPTVASPGQVTLAGQVFNSGSTDANAPFLSYFEVCPTQTSCNSNTWTNIPITTLKGGETKDVSAQRLFSSGIYQVRLCADGTGAVTETNKANNCSDWTTLTITGSVVGTCSSTTANMCDAGTVANKSKTATDYTWTCLGSGGGSDQQCSMPINGGANYCSATPNQCTNGPALNPSKTATTYTWTCSGSAAICSAPIDATKTPPKPIFKEL